MSGSLSGRARSAPRPTISLQHHLAELDERPLSADIDTRRFGNYRCYADVVGSWRLLEQLGARARSIGQTPAGSPLFALEIGPADSDRVSAIMAGIHPIEWIGVETMLHLLGALVDSPPTDRRVIAFPLLNVDGFRRVENDLRAGKRRWRRTNRNGVDLNRNWPTHWRPSPRRRSLLSGYNRGGPTPLSEPEIAAAVATLDEVARSAAIDVALSLHSIGRMILYPYGGSWAAPPDTERHRRAAAAIKARLSRRYTVRQSARWVPGAFANGMEIDTLHDRFGAVSLLVECSLGGASPLRPASLLHPFRIFNPPDPDREATELAAALEPFVRGADNPVGPHP